MKSSQITIKDIARELDISPSTVSRALKDHPDISIKTKKLVKELAEKLNYQPNSIALSLRSRKSNTIGVIIPQIVHFFFSTVISGIEDIAYAAGYSVIVSQSNESYDREVIDTQALFNNRVDGILASLSKETMDYSHFQSLHSRGIPLVFYDRVCDPIECSKVIVDDFDAGYMATKHLIDQGYKRIAHLAGPESLNMFRQRLDGYKKALTDHGLEIREEYIKQENASEDEDLAKELTQQLLKLKEIPDAIFANNDIAALGAMITIKDHGLKIPDDIGIVGFSNWRFTSLTEPTITTVSQPGFEMGQEAARLLIEAIEADDNDTITAVTKVLKTDLVVRGSSVR